MAASPQTLRTLLHISDLHIGDIDPVRGDNPLDAITLAWWRLSPIFHGYLGHTWIALSNLADLYFDLEEQVGKDRLYVVITGDLTANGKQEQFALARDYLTGRGLRSGGPTPLGLRLDKGHYTAIPGNHDRWPGKRFMLGSSTSAFAITFPPPYPKNCIRIPLRHDCSLVIAEIDSDSGVKNWSRERLLARGSFVDQCTVLEASLGLIPKDELRVLAVHHSTIDNSNNDFILKIDSKSRRALERLITNTGISMLLTGHLHTHAFSTGEQTGWLREARCGTTTVRDRFFPPHPQTSNIALIHRLIDDGDGIRWKTEVWRRRLQPGPFEHCQNEDHDFGYVWALA